MSSQAGTVFNWFSLLLGIGQEALICSVYLLIRVNIPATTSFNL